MTEERLSEVTNAAIAAFWTVVKKNLPHVTRDAEVDNALARDLTRVATTAVKDWSEKHDRARWLEQGTVVKISLGPDFLGVIEKGFLAVVRESDFLTFRTWAKVRFISAPDLGNGLRDIQLDRDRGVWQLTINRSRIDVVVAMVSGNPFTVSVVPGSQDLVVLGPDKVEVRRITLPDKFPASAELRNSVRTLVGELNLAHHALALGGTISVHE